MPRKKTETISFKADTALLDAIEGIANRSEFIRGAILAALESACPLCSGTGTLTPDQKRHWNEFAEDHPIRTCGHCHEPRIYCARKP
ncbi:MAG: CopG family transcriptional regulator [Candidatus Eisenbacteria bacterium]|nr:CopG family transcriptional regulator [Candidatus Eisenbacteria bacterium]